MFAPRYNLQERHRIRERQVQAMTETAQQMLKIRKQILALRDTGRTNMFDTNAVQVIANEMHFYELVIFIEEHKKEYGNFILTGDLPGLTDEEAQALKQENPS